MIERAEREGLLRPGDTIVEAGSGNTGNAMSMVAAVKGYRMLVVMPDGMSGERLAISRAFGTQVLTLGDFHANDALAKVAELGRKPGHFAPQQFDSEWNRGVFVPFGDDLERQSGAAGSICTSPRAAAQQRGTAELLGEGVDAGLRWPVRSRVPAALLVRSEKAPARGLSRRPISRPGASRRSRSTWRTRSRLSRTPGWRAAHRSRGRRGSCRYG